MYSEEHMNQRSAYVDSQILLMKWDDQKDGWIPDMSAMHEYHSGNLRIYHPSDAEEYLITMPGNVRWLVMFDGADIREVPEMPWIAFAIQGMLETEIARLDEYLLTGSEVVAAAVLASLSGSGPSPSPSPSPRIESKPQPLPVHIRTIVLERAESEGQTCPITLTPIRTQTASVTSCGHIFQTAAIQEWLSTNETCPECRQKCSSSSQTK
jgi:hypothetical protein